TQEDINTNYDEIDYVSSRAELKERWRKQLKFTTLGNYYDKKQEQITGKVASTDDYSLDENNADVDEPVTSDAEEKVAVADGVKKELKSNAQLEKEARETTLASMDEYFDFSEELERKDYFSVYIN